MSFYSLQCPGVRQWQLFLQGLKHPPSKISHLQKSDSNCARYDITIDLPFCAASSMTIITLSSSWQPLHQSKYGPRCWRCLWVLEWCWSVRCLVTLYPPLAGWREAAPSKLEAKLLWGELMCCDLLVLIQLPFCIWYVVYIFLTQIEKCNSLHWFSQELWWGSLCMCCLQCTWPKPQCISAQSCW